VLRPLSRAAGFFPTVRAVYWGVPLAIIGSPFALGPAFRTIGELGVTRFSCTPAQVGLLLQAAPEVPPQLTSVIVSGAPIAPATLIALTDYLQDVAVGTSYGLAEVGIVTHLTGDELRRRPDSCGRVVPGRALSIVGESGEKLPCGVVGQIAVEVADCTSEDGYWRCGPSVSARFVDGRLHTNDRGYLDDQGHLVLTERTAEVIKVAGRAVSAPSIEATLRGVDQHLSLTVVGVPHPRYGEVPAVVFEQCDERGPSEQTLQRIAQQHLRSHELPRWFLARRRLPRTTTGKVHRKLVEAQTRAWVGLWPGTLAWAGRFWPARPLGGQGTLAGLCAVDGAADDWRGALAMSPPVPAGRDIVAVCAISSRHVVPVGWARVFDGVDTHTSGVRIVDGPWLVPEYRSQVVEAPWLAHLLACASLLPGPTPVATVVRPTDSSQTALLSSMGFSPLPPDELIWARMPPPPPEMSVWQVPNEESAPPMDVPYMLEDDRLAKVVRELA
jgi:hypothetical protein